MKSIVMLTFLGGVNEVGGNCILLEDLGYDVKLIVDFGVNFEKSIFYSIGHIQVLSGQPYIIQKLF